MPKRKREVHRGRGGRKRRKETEGEAEALDERELAGGLDQPPEMVHDDFIPFADDALDLPQNPLHQDTREFFGMLEEEEQEYFRRADELLELNDFPTPEDRGIFLQSVFKEAKGKELKLASSQSCSRLMERLILLSTAAQKKHLFEAFANHFPTLVTHRFGSHCCEQLFLQSAAVVTEELNGKVLGSKGTQAEGEMEDGQDEDHQDQEPPAPPMEDLFLLVLDELEEQLTSLITDVFASHALRVLLTILSGRPLDDLSTKSVLQSKKKENITVSGSSAQPTAGAGDDHRKTRPVPASFSLAVQKIIADTMSSLDSTALGVMVKHPTGNPTLQLLLELDISLNTKSKDRKKKKGVSAEDEEEQKGPQSATLLEKLLPGAPASLGDDQSEASIFVNSAIYDPIASRLLETLLANCPGRIFKAIYSHIMKPRLGHLLRNETATYCIMKALVRLSREDLADAVEQAVPRVEMLVSKGRFNVLVTLFERCEARGATASTEALLKAVTSACASGPGGSLVRALCYLEDEPQKSAKVDAADGEDKGEGKDQEDCGDEEHKKGKMEKGKRDKKQKNKKDDGGNTPLADPPKKKDDLIRNGAKLATTLVGIPGPPALAVQSSLLALPTHDLLRLATSSNATARFMCAAMRSPPSTALFHKRLVATLIVPHAMDLARSEHGYKVLCEVVSVPSRGDGGENGGGGSVAMLPFFVKQSVVAALAGHEDELRELWTGRKVWRAWRGDLWLHRRPDWIRFAKEAEPEETRLARAPVVREKQERSRKFRSTTVGWSSGRGRHGEPRQRPQPLGLPSKEKPEGAGRKGKEEGSDGGDGREDEKDGKTTKKKKKGAKAKGINV